MMTVLSVVPRDQETFRLLVADFALTAKLPLAFGALDAANRIRGLWGKSLFGGPLYEKLFAPPRREDGPSGLKDPPRPFVLRTRHLANRNFGANEPIPFRVHIFDPRLAPLNAKPIAVPLSATSTVKVIRVDFLTPTELKGGSLADFAIFIARLRDRISTLRALYGGGPLAIDFAGLAERARAIRTVSCDLHHVEMARTSRRTGQTHSIGGSVGHAIYEGSLTEFLPYLEAGRWTGVGRQTVWGNGEFSLTILDPPAGANPV